MPEIKLLSLLQSTTLLSDGAMGTMLHARGVSFEKCFDELNLTNPAAVADIHREYIEAGAHIILTNTFGANRFKLAKHGLEEQTHRDQPGRRGAWPSGLWQRPQRNVLIAGDVGPLGVRIAPFGRVQPEEARAAFAEQIAVLVDAGADLIVIETISDLYEIQEAIRAAKAGPPRCR